MYSTILLPTDGSDGATAALDHAQDLAQQYDATLHVLFVTRKEAGPTGMVDREHEDVEKSDMTNEPQEDQRTGMSHQQQTDSPAMERSQALVNDVADSVDEAVPVETTVLTGNPYERILDYADEQDVDLLVMGTHGRTGVDRYLLGSVTEKVVRTSDVPVLTVRMGS